MSKNDGIQKKYRRLQKAIKPYGYRIMCYGRSGHAGIYDQQGNRIISMSGTPSVKEQAESHTFKTLQKLGLIPENARL